MKKGVNFYMYNFRTDLALERRDLYNKAHNIEKDIDGIETEEEKINEQIIVSRVKVTNEKGEEAIGKPQGNYITIDIRNLKIAHEREIQEASEAVTKELKALLKTKVCDIEPEALDFVTNTRQQACLKRAKASLEQALLASQVNELQDLISIDVKSALLALDELTGELVTDKLLDNIFENFCIGK